MLEVDDDSVDLIVQGRNFVGRPSRSPQVQLQLKCTSQDFISRDGNSLNFPLPLKNYEDLRGENVPPRYLVVMVVPDSEDDWVLHGADCLTLRNRCYWTHLRDEGDTGNTTNVTIAVPIVRQLCRETLHEMMESAASLENYDGP